MSKKKRRYHRVRYNYSSKDRHHIWYQGRHYNSGALARLRNYWYSVVMIPREPVHKIIHEYIGDIPVPSEENAQKLLDALHIMSNLGMISESDKIERRLLVFIDLLDHTEQPTVEALEKQLSIIRKFYNRPP